MLSAKRIHHLPYLLLFLLTGTSLAQEAPLRISEESFRNVSRVVLADAWRYSPVDQPSHARPGFDDSNWSSVRPRMRRGELPEDWNGLGWFRLRFDVASALTGVPLAMRVLQAGASEVYLDGELLVACGKIGKASVPWVPRTSLESRLFALEKPGEHVLAVRYQNLRAEAFLNVGWYAGFQLALGPANRVVPEEVAAIHMSSRFVWFFTGIFLSFALLHGLLFLFQPASKENSYFALLCAVSAVLVFLLVQKNLMQDPRFVLFSEPVMNVSGLLLGVFALRFFYGIFNDRMPRQFFVLLAVVASFGLWSLFRPGEALQAVFLTMLVSCLEMIRAVAVALHKKKNGALILGSGIFALGAGFAVGLLSNLGILPSTSTLGTLVPFSSVILLLVSMSIYLSREFARTTKELQKKLVEVERLSEEKLRQEQTTRRQELEKKLLEVEYKRKVEELEEARELQLSMLPKRLPKLEGLEVAAHMTTATEVGGDYYDFHLAEDGTLTVAIGDATGHGMKAGTMVTATKSLFNVLGQESDLLATLNRSALALKRMNFRKLAMALTLLQYRGGTVRLAAAGMPPALIYRASTGKVESVLLAGMPLGSFAGFPYREEELRLAPEDVVLLMSDGFPERLNSEDEMLGYENAVALFAEAASASPQVIVERLVQAGDEWAADRVADDDVTFIVMKVTRLREG